MLRVILAAEPGRQYTFQSVELPGLDAAGEEAASLRQAFAVKSGDPVIAENVIKAGTDLQVALGEEGFALAEIGEQQIEIDHETQHRQPGAAGPARPGRSLRPDQRLAASRHSRPATSRPSPGSTLATGSSGPRSTISAAR